MEKLFHYIWRHRIFPLSSLKTTCGKSVEVVDSGLPNYDSGPDFFNAKVKIDGQMWVGNVELHILSSDWYQHGHDTDRAYDSVILHVVNRADREVVTSDGRMLTQLELAIPEALKENYDELLKDDRYPRCHKLIGEIPQIKIHSWLSALTTERLERKTRDIEHRLQECNDAWEDTFFRTLARNFGFGVNSEAFEMWARCLPLKAVAHHRDDLFQVEAIFMGQAGLLEVASTPLSHRDEVEKDAYFYRLRREYEYLKHKFSLQPMDGRMWKFMRMRPQNFPYIRLSQLASLYCNHKTDMRSLLECKDIKELEQHLQCSPSEYWQTHYVFGLETEKNEKRLSKTSIDIIILNSIIPLLFAYGKYYRNEDLCYKALDMLDKLKPEDNNIVRLWKECGVEAESAADTQAMIQLKKEYCDKKECLRCRIGCQYLKLVYK